MISVFFTVLNQLRVLHWQTFSFAEHEALGKAYNELSELFDKFVEVYYGKYGRPTDPESYKTDVMCYKHFNSNAYSVDLHIASLVLEVNRTLESILTEADTELLNIRDEIIGEMNKLRYLLSLS
jgi:hypothetical protein